ncbi:MAG: hypothetical protein Q3988_02590 [Gemella sp.]|nr:hypothetical protein [Gemella sp.]
MIKENLKYYIGMGAGVVACILSWIVISDKVLLSVMNIFSLWIFSYSFITMYDKKMMKENKEYRISLNDERETRIREKTGETISIIFLLYFSVLCVYFALNDKILEAVLTGVVIFIHPILFKIVSYIHGRKI